MRERFFAKVDKSGPWSAECGSWCWVWNASRKPPWGYGQFVISHNVNRRAHRVSYEFIVGPIPEGLVLDHLCRRPWCVNPDHLDPVTQLENVQRGRGHGRETHCPQGHEYNEANTYLRPTGGRKCRACAVLVEQRRRARLTE